MGRSLASKPNTVAPGGSYPFGRIVNNDGSGNGTPVTEEVYGDFHVFFDKLASLAGVALNDLPENNTNGYQFIQALLTVRDVTFQAMKTLLSGYDADTEGLILSGCVVSGAGPYNVSTGVVYLNGEFMILPAAVGVTMPRYIVPDTIGESRMYPAKLQAAAPGAGQYVKLIATGSENDRYFKSIGKTKHIAGGTDEGLGTVITYKTKKEILLDVSSWNLNYSVAGQREYGLIHNIPNLRSKYPIVEVCLRNDAGILVPQFSNGAAAGSEQVSSNWYIDSSDEAANRIVLRVTSGSPFDSTSWDDPAVMRGYARITYYE